MHKRTRLRRRPGSGRCCDHAEHHLEWYTCRAIDRSEWHIPRQTISGLAVSHTRGLCNAIDNSCTVCGVPSIWIQNSSLLIHNPSFLIQNSSVFTCGVGARRSECRTGHPKSHYFSLTESSMFDCRIFICAFHKTHAHAIAKVANDEGTVLNNEPQSPANSSFSMENSSF